MTEGVGTGLEQGSMVALSIAPNFRDIGGLALPGGQRIRPGLVFRSEALLEPTVEDAATLASLGIVLVCDLRSDGERDHAPNAWWIAHGVERLDLDVLAGVSTEDGPWTKLQADPGVHGAIGAMRSVYAAMPVAAAAPLAIILRRIAARDLPILIHCTAGKDRTGFIIAMILAALGIRLEDIVADYLTSSGRRTDRATHATRLMVKARVGDHVSAEAIEKMMGVEREYLETSFAVIEDRFGGLRGYFAFAGVDDALLEAVRVRLLD